MIENKYNIIINRFKQYFPNLYEKTVDWWPASKYYITFKLNDGDLIEFNYTDCSIRRVRPAETLKEKDEFKKELGHNIQKFIKRTNITQNELADTIGVSRAMMSRYITGTSVPGADKLYLLSKLLNCSVNDFFGYHDEESLDE